MSNGFMKLTVTLIFALVLVNVYFCQRRILRKSLKSPFLLSRLPQGFQQLDSGLLCNVLRKSIVDICNFKAGALILRSALRWRQKDRNENERE